MKNISQTLKNLLWLAGKEKWLIRSKKEDAKS